MSAAKLVLSWIVIGGKRLKTALKILATLTDPADPLVIAFRTALELILNARNPKASITQTGQVADTPTATQAYSTCDDKIHWTFYDNSGQAHIHKTPAPMESLFQADNHTVEITNAGAAAFISWVLDTCVTQGGDGYARLGQAQRGWRI